MRVPPGAVVVGFDGSPHSTRAVVWAGNEAAARHAPLLLVHVLDEPGPPASRSAPDGPPVDQLVAAAVERAAVGHPTLAVDTQVVSGDPAAALLDLGEAAALIVVGSRGLGPVRTRLLGSVSATLATRCACPVAVVRPYPLGPMRKGVLVGVDGSVASIPTVELAFGEAAGRRIPLTVLHAVDGPYAEDDRARLTDAVADLSEKYPGLLAQVEERRDLSPRDLSCAGDDMDILLVGRRDGDLHAHPGHRDVSIQVVEHASTVVMVVPEVAGPTVPADRDLMP